MVNSQQLDSLNAEELRALASELLAQMKRHDASLASKDQEIQRKDGELKYRQAKIDQLTHEMAVLKRWKFGRSGERLDAAQLSLLDETLDADIAAIELELEQLAPTPRLEAQAGQPKRTRLPPGLRRVEITHEPESTVCTTPGCGCTLRRIGEDIGEKLDYTPGVFTVQRHVRGKWACSKCESLTQAPVPAQIIDKGIPTAGLLAQVLVAKYADHLPLYRQESIFGRAGFAIARSTLGAWVGMCGVQLQPLVDALKGEILSHTVLHADETPVAMLKPGNKKTHRAYLWAYTPGAFEDLKAVVYDFCESRAGAHARSFLGDWQGALVCDDYVAYKQLFTQGLQEAGCMAHYPECSFIRGSAHEVTVRTRSRPGASRHINPANFNGSLHPIWPGSRMSLVWLLRHPGHSNPSPRPAFGTSCAYGVATAVLARAARGNTCNGSVGSDATAAPSVLMRPPS